MFLIFYFINCLGLFLEIHHSESQIYFILMKVYIFKISFYFNKNKLFIFLYERFRNYLVEFIFIMLSLLELYDFEKRC